MYSIILAAGKSKRMGVDKAFLEINGKSFIEIITEKLKDISKIIIVAGKHNFKKINNIYGNKFKIILNDNYKLGQINSVKLAVSYLIKNNIKESVMINLVDQPLIKKATYKKMILEHKKNKDKIIIPFTKIEKDKNKRGHPIIIPNTYFNLILKAPYDKGLHWVTHHKKVKVKDIYISDRNIIKDFDTYEDYLKHIEKLKK